MTQKQGRGVDLKLRPSSATWGQQIALSSSHVCSTEGGFEVRENSGLLGIGARMEEYFVNKEGNHSCKRKTVLGIGPVPLPSVQTER